MSRPTNAELLAKTPELQPGTEAAVAAVRAAYPQATILEAKPVGTEGHQVTVGWVEADGTTTTIMELTLDAANSIHTTEPRPDVPPGQAKDHKEPPGHAKDKDHKDHGHPERPHKMP